MEINSIIPDMVDYVPPKVLRDTGPKELRAGQLWAIFTPGSDSGLVIRILRPGIQGCCFARQLAGDSFLVGDAVVRGDMLLLHHAVLVQSEPTLAPLPPAELWAEVYGTTAPPAAACQLGARCPIHNPPPAAPRWVPEIDDFDLLPDA